MKRFWKDVTVGPASGGWQVALDGRPLRTQGGKALQIVPTRALAELLAAEWRAQGPEVDPHGFPARDLADYALDRVAQDRAGVIAKLTAYGDTDTLLYRADPDEALHRRQLAKWEPLVSACEARHAIAFHRISGVIARPQPLPTLAALQALLEGLDDFTLAALEPLASIAASLITALAVLEEGADPAALFAAAHLEADWQAEQWGTDAEAEQTRARRLQAFTLATEFVRAANSLA